MGNVCAKNCFYCGIRRDNRVLERYQLDEPEILEAVQRNIALQYGSIVLQSGEIESEAHTLFIEQLLRKITAMTDGTLGITLSLGEQTADTFRRWRSAGAHRYLLRIETSNPRLYARFHPADHSLERRRECLRHLRTYDYQVGSGVMSKAAASATIRAPAAGHAMAVDAAAGAQVGAAAVAFERVAGGEQALQGRGVESAAPGLVLDRPVGMQPARGQGAQLGRGRARNLPRRVEVFDPHQPATAGAPGHQPAPERRQQRAGMQRSGGRGRETAAVAWGGRHGD